MKAVRALAALVLVCLLSLSCEAPTTPPTDLPQQPEALIGSLVEPTGLLQCSALPSATSARIIGSEGGSISAGPHTLVIPPAALSQPTAITMTLLTGRGVNAVSFAPEGLQFRRPVALTMSYTNCNLLGTLLPKRIAYIDGELNVLEYLLSLDNLFAKRVTGKLDHFSDYVVAW
ncbi:MAG TPA: hypothetical protein VJ755_10855 [Gemmatimonadales bacterium]|nr:hypothetical protein [Gemmatimonadales bacterium]